MKPPASVCQNVKETYGLHVSSVLSRVHLGVILYISPDYEVLSFVIKHPPCVWPVPGYTCSVQKKYYSIACKVQYNTVHSKEYTV